MATIHFNVDAYTARLIGRENVSKLDGAILELVKNTYDADASVCLLYFEKETNTLYLGDNGTGMTTDTIIKHWMTIGSSSKRVKYKTRRGRIQTGAKGIGRFALDRISDKCELITISETEQLLWSVDWSSFYQGNNITDTTALLENVEISFKDFTKNIINRNVSDLITNHFTGTGTIFKLTHLRDEWDIETFNSIKINLKSLIPPEFKEVFKIYLFDEETKLTDAAVLQDSDDFPYDYKVEFSVNNTGQVKIGIFRDEFDFQQDFNKILAEAGFTSDDRKYFGGTPITSYTTLATLLGFSSNIENTIGEFSGILYFAKLTAPKAERSKYYYKDITGRQDIRDSFGGIRIYRDGFRVRPYGDPKTSSSDWLGLSARKNKSPAAISHETGAWRVNSDQIHGSIFISRVNIYLPDQTNREGIVETKEFRILKSFIENVIKLFERDRQYVFRNLSRYYDKQNPTAPIEAELAKKLAEDKKKKDKADSKSGVDYLPAVIEVSKVNEIIEKNKATIDELENEIKMLRVLATTGIVTNTYVHEIKDITHKLNMKIILAKEALEEDGDIAAALGHINIANALRETFTSWFKVTIESVRRDKRKMQNISIGYLLDKLVGSWRETLKPTDITIDLNADEVNLNCFPYEIESMINNLIANSVSSFDKVKVSNKKIMIKIRNTTSGIEIQYYDTGVGLSQAYKLNPRLILESFETDKVSAAGELVGTGMGMWIINRTVAEYNGSIDLSENIRQETGFHIRIYLENKQNGGF